MVITHEAAAEHILLLPDEIVVEILVWLDTRSMLRASCVNQRIRSLLVQAAGCRWAMAGQWILGGRRSAVSRIKTGNGQNVLSFSLAFFSQPLRHLNVLRAAPNGNWLVGACSAASTRELTIYQSDGVVVATLTCGPSSDVRAVATDGEHIACGLANGHIRAWRADTREPLEPLPHEHDRAVWGLELRGDVLVSGAGDSKALIWSLEARTVRATLDEHADCVRSVTIRGEAIATGSDDKTARVWPRTGGDSLLTLPHPDSVLAVLLRGQLLVTGCLDRVVRTWCVGTGQLTRELRGHSGYVCSVTRCGALLVSGSSNGQVKVWGLREGEGECVATLDHAGGVSGVAVAPSGEWVAGLSNGREGGLAVWRPGAAAVP